MPEAADPGGLVSADELRELAGWFDEFEFAFDPLAVRAREAEAKFNDRVQKLYKLRVHPLHPELAYPVFLNHLRQKCRQFLHRNPPR